LPSEKALFLKVKNSKSTKFKLYHYSREIISNDLIFLKFLILLKKIETVTKFTVVTFCI